MIQEDNNKSQNQTTTYIDKLVTIPQYILPQHLLSKLMFKLTRSKVVWFKNAFIRFIVKNYQVNLAEAESAELADYPSFNAFFTRQLNAGARLIEGGMADFCSPVDGKVSQIGAIDSQRNLLQAKGHRYSVESLLTDADLAKQFDGGQYTTIYLSPRDYHRIHMPITGTLSQMIYVPGKLFSVSPRTVRAVPDLFARNERVISIFDTEYGPIGLVLVGAIFVGSMETVWQGQITPPYGKQILKWDYAQKSIHIEKGKEMGRFNMGSTIILLLPKGAPSFLSQWAADTPIKLGQALTKS